ncbi:hypothetical protein ACH4SP_42250 [Streptomyces sp. NPDC021093]|uniref:hypothetical protein n=1 Tax=Streptomyces sp. NPDC021093 TaxID=3365112 RepID=UPI0037B84EDF
MAEPTVTASREWWGFELHLNNEAVELLDDIDELVQKIVGEIPEVGEIIAGALEIQAAVIKAVANGGAVKLVSPWICPLWLIPIPETPPDYKLYWTVYDPDNGWSADQPLPHGESVIVPALADSGGHLHCVYRGGAGDEKVYWTVYDPDNGWGDATVIEGNTTRSGPALAVFRDKLYCAYRGSDNDCLYWITYDGSTWSAAQYFPRHFSASGPSLAVFQDRLYCVHQGSGEDTNLYWAVFDGDSWSADNRFPNHMTRVEPGLSVFQDQLHCVHRGNTDDRKLWHTVFDGEKWSEDQPIGADSRDAPALAVFRDHLYCVHDAHDDDSMWWTTFDGTSWSPDRQFPGTHWSGEGPGLISYRDKHGTAGHLLCVHRGNS